MIFVFFCTECVEKRSLFCRSRRDLSNEPLLPKISVYTNTDRPTDRESFFRQSENDLLKVVSKILGDCLAVSAVLLPECRAFVALPKESRFRIWLRFLRGDASHESEVPYNFSFLYCDRSSLRGIWPLRSVIRRDAQALG